MKNGIQFWDTKGELLLIITSPLEPEGDRELSDLDTPELRSQITALFGLEVDNSSEAEITWNEWE